MENEKYVSLKELADLLGMERSNARKYILKIGYKPEQRRTSSSKNQLTMAFTKVEAQQILEQRKGKGFLNSGIAVNNEYGVFYIIKPVPKLDPKRIKLGFTTDINERLAQFRTIVPEAICLKTWPCKKTWEKTVIDCLAQKKCNLIINEIFECDNIDELIKQADMFFEIMPQLIKEIENNKL